MSKARELSELGDKITVDGSGNSAFTGNISAVNVTVSGTVDGRDVAADGTKLDGIESGATADQTASEILTAIKTVDGAGSGLDADSLDGKQLATIETEYQSYADTAVSNLVAAAPTTLDTLNELAAALGDDPNFATTVTNSIATKLPLTGGTMTGNITFNNTQLFDGRDVSADGAKLDGIEAGADVTDTSNVTAAGALMTTGGTLTGNLSFGDNDKAIFGAGSDLQIYHDGTGSYVDEQGTGGLILRGTNLFLRSSTNENYIGAVADGAVDLYHDNAPKLSTTSTGVDVTGTITADGLTLGDNQNIIVGNSVDLYIYHNGSNSHIEDRGTGDLVLKANNNFWVQDYGTNETMIRADSNGAVNLYYDNSLKFATSSTGISVTGTVAATAFTGDGSGLTGIQTSPYDQSTSSTGFFALPSGTTAQRPVSPAAGYVRFNTTEGKLEIYNGSEWTLAEASIAFTAQLFLVGGGGGSTGGVFGSYYGGGGGGGLTTSTSSQTLYTGTTYTITVGAGGGAGGEGAGKVGGTGGTSSFTGSGGVNLSATGGFGDISDQNLGGGNALYSGAGTTGSAPGGVGAGAGGNASTNQAGATVSTSITGTTVSGYGGGGNDGNGQGTRTGSTTAGFGGGAQGTSSGGGGAIGGSGRVIIRSARQALATSGSPTVTTVGSDYVYQFDGSGTITFA